MIKWWQLKEYVYICETGFGQHNCELSWIGLLFLRNKIPEKTLYTIVHLSKKTNNTCIEFAYLQVDV